MDYEQLLDRADDKIDREQTTEERFKMPEAEIAHQGNHTIITNFNELVKGFRREPQHLMKFLLREMAVPGELKGGRLSLQGKFGKEQIGKKLESYISMFVMCSSCGKPDTHLVSEGGLTKISCEACKAKRVVRSLK